MTEFEKEEFWKSLGRLYDSTVKTGENIDKLGENIETLRLVSESHEKRLDKLEVVQQWLAEKERKREKEDGK